jgi:putative ABC transport system permease protein
MLTTWLNHPVALGFAQAAVAAGFALVVALAARRRGIRLTRETAVALARGLAQVAAVGLVLAALLQGPRWTSPLILGAMTAVAARISSRRAEGLPGVFGISLAAIAGGAGAVIALLVLLGVLDTAVATLVPVGSMIVANAMNGNALALERFRADVAAHTGYIEAALSLGAAPETAVAPYAQAAMTASLIPSINSLRSLGIVWIPGLMAGMVLSGASPFQASLYQFVVLAAILAASGLTCLISTALVVRRVFTAAGQLALR